MSCMRCIKHQLRFADAIAAAKLKEEVKQNVIAKINRKNITNKEELIEKLPNYTTDELFELYNNITRGVIK